jgi:hypothetical protein
LEVPKVGRATQKIAVFLGLVFATATPGWSAELSVIRRIEAGLDERLSALANILCHERIARYVQNGPATSFLDSLDTNVEIDNGVERYSGIRSKHKVFGDMASVPGSWSVGEMATVLRTTLDAIRQGTGQIGQDELAGAGPTVVMAFRYPASSLRWYLKVKSEIYWMAFEGRVWASPKTGEIRRISWHACDPPAESGVSDVLWTVDFSPMNIFSRTLTLPQQAVYQVTYPQVTYPQGPNRIDRNVTNFSHYRRYGADSAIHFDE